MKILFSLTYYTPYISGLTLYVKRLGEALAGKGYQVSVLTMNFDKHCRSAEIVNGVKVVRAKPLVKISKGFLSIDWFVKSWQEVKKADVVFINLPQFEGLIPAILGKLFGKKVISIYHCEVVLPAGILNKFINWLLNASNLLSLRLSDEIITYTEDFAKNSKILPHFRSKLKFVYPPIIEPKIEERVQKVLNEKISLISRPGLEGAKGRAFNVGVAARLAAEKGMEYLFEAIPKIDNVIARSEERATWQSPTGSPRSLRSLAMTQKATKTPRMVARQRPRLLRGGGIKLAIAGSINPVGEEKYKRKILDLVGKYKNYVVFLGELKEDEMGSFYSLLDILILPSINSTEAFGMVQVEAMMMGVPVVATDLPGVRVPIQKTGMGLLVPIKDSKRLANAIIEILLNKKKYIKESDLVNKEFSFGKTIEFYEKIIHEE